MRFRAPHLACIAVGLLAGYGISAWSPFAFDLQPKLAPVVRRLHEATLKASQSDSALAKYRHRDSIRVQRIAVLELETSRHLRVSNQLAGSNRRLTDSLRSLMTDTLGLRLLAVLDSGVANQDRACVAAVSSCSEARDSLKVAIVERDSIVSDRTAQRDSSLAVARDGLAVARSLNRQLWGTRLLALLTTLAAILK